MRRASGEVCHPAGCLAISDRDEAPCCRSFLGFFGFQTAGCSMMPVDDGRPSLVYCCSLHQFRLFCTFTTHKHTAGIRWHTHMCAFMSFELSDIRQILWYNKSWKLITFRISAGQWSNLQSIIQSHVHATWQRNLGLFLVKQQAEPFKGKAYN